MFEWSCILHGKFSTTENITITGKLHHHRNMKMRRKKMQKLKHVTTLQLM